MVKIWVFSIFHISAAMNECVLCGVVGFGWVIIIPDLNKRIYLFHLFVVCCHPSDLHTSGVEMDGSIDRIV